MEKISIIQRRDRRERKRFFKLQPPTLGKMTRRKGWINMNDPVSLVADDVSVLDDESICDVSVDMEFSIVSYSSAEELPHLGSSRNGCSDDRSGHRGFEREYFQTVAASVYLKHHNDSLLMPHRSRSIEQEDDDRSSDISTPSLPIREWFNQPRYALLPTRNVIHDSQDQSDLTTYPQHASTCFSSRSISPPTNEPTIYRSAEKKHLMHELDHFDEDVSCQFSSDGSLISTDTGVAELHDRWPARSIENQPSIKRFPSVSVVEHRMSSATFDSQNVRDMNESDDLRMPGSINSNHSNEITVPSSGKIQFNVIKLNIYDLISKDTLLQMPFGCVWEIGKCFNDVNTALHELGTGVYHVGVEVNGVEYAYGATSIPGRSGVFSCTPRFSPGYQFRTTIDLGKRALVRKTWVVVQNHSKSSGRPTTSFSQRVEHVDGQEIVKDMAREYMGVDYDILRRNCCTFAREVCLRLGIGEREIPSWFRNMAESGALTQDLARATVLPLKKVLPSEEPMSIVSHTVSEDDDDKYDEDRGFEIIARRHVSSQGTRHLFVIVSESPLKSTLLNY